MLLQGHTFLDAEGTSGRSTYPGMQNNSEHEAPKDNPWESSFFHDMQLDEIKIIFTIIYSIIKIGATTRNKLNKPVWTYFRCQVFDEVNQEDGTNKHDFDHTCNLEGKKANNGEGDDAKKT